MDEQAELLSFIRTTLLAGKEVEIGADTMLFEQRLLDSINILYLIGYVENRLGRRLNENDIVMANFQSPAAMLRAFFADARPQ